MAVGIRFNVHNHVRIKPDDDQGIEANKPEIVYVAEELGLYTRPTATSTDHWRATCPGTSHFLKLQASNDLFFCGYCKRGGGIDELRIFVKERTGDQLHRW